MIPLFKIGLERSHLSGLPDLVDSGYIGQGEIVEQFEEALAPFVGSSKVLSTNSCTSALWLAYYLAGVREGTEVLVSPMTCLATVAPIVALGAYPVWVDIIPDLGSIDPVDAGRKVTTRTAAVCAVDWSGIPALWQDLKGIGLPLIVDAAHSIGATRAGKLASSVADFVCFSFQAIKHLTTVDGGALVCQRREDYRRGKLLRWFGLDREKPQRDFRSAQDVGEVGFKFHMNDIAASLGCKQISSLSHRLNRCLYIANRYKEVLRGQKRLRYLSDAGTKSVYWMFTILAEDREGFNRCMLSHGIQVSTVHARLDMLSAFKDSSCTLPGLDAFCSSQTNIPCGWWMTNEQVALVEAALRNYVVSR